MGVKQAMPNYANYTMLELLRIRRAVDEGTNPDQFTAIGAAIEERVTERRRFINPNYGESNFLNDPNSWGKQTSRQASRGKEFPLSIFEYFLFDLLMTVALFTLCLVF